MPDAMPRTIERPHGGPRSHRAVDRSLDRRLATKSRERGRPVALADRDRQLTSEVVPNERPDLLRRLRASHPPDVDTGDRDTGQDPIRMTHLVAVRGIGDPAEHEQHDPGHRNDDGGDRAEVAPMGVSSSGHGDYRYLWIASDDTGGERTGLNRCRGHPSAAEPRRPGHTRRAPSLPPRWRRRAPRSARLPSRAR